MEAGAASCGEPLAAATLATGAATRAPGSASCASKRGDSEALAQADDSTLGSMRPSSRNKCRAR
jgi:hypothetical protein